MISLLCCLRSAASPADSKMERITQDKAPLRTKGSLELLPFRTLDRTDPIRSLDAINQAVEKDPSNQNLQKFRWYLAARTGRTVDVLERQERDYRKCRDLWLGEFRLFCLFESEWFSSLLQAANLLVTDHPGSGEAVFVRAWYAYLTNNYEIAKRDIESLSVHEKSAALSGWADLIAGSMGKTVTAGSRFEQGQTTFGGDVVWQTARASFNLKLHQECYGDSGCHEQLLDALNRSSKLPASAALRAQTLLNVCSANRLWKHPSIIRQNCGELDESVPEYGDYLLSHLLKEQGKDLLRQFPNWRIYHQAAIGSMKQEKFDEAKKLFEISIQHNPRQFSSYYQLGWIASEPKRQLDCFARGLSSSPEHCYLVAARAAALEKIDPARAANDWLRAFELEPTCLRFLKRYCVLRARLKLKNSELLSELDRHCKKRDGGPQVALLRASVLEQLGLHSEAESELLVACHKWPGFVGTWVELGMFLQQRGRVADALEKYAEGIDRTGGIKLFVERARLNLTRQQYQKVISDCDSAIVKIAHCGSETNLPDALYLRGYAFRALSRKNEALKCFESGSRLEPSNLGWYREIMPMLSAEQYEKARQIFRKYKTELVPQKPVYSQYVEYLVRTKRWQEVSTLAGKMLREFPGLEFTWTVPKTGGPELELLQQQLCNYARNRCRTNPKEPHTWLMLYNALSYLGLKEEAQRALTSGINSNPNAVVLLLERAKLRNGDPSRRLADCARIRSLASAQDVLLLSFEADAYDELGLVEKSIVARKAYVVKNPRDFHQADLLIDSLLDAARFSQAIDQSRRLLSLDDKRELSWTKYLSSLHLAGRTVEYEQARKRCLMMGLSQVADKIELKNLKYSYKNEGFGTFTKLLKEPSHRVNERKSMLRSQALRAVNNVERADLLIKEAELNASTGNYRKAVECCNRALAIQNSDHRIYLKRAAAHHALGNEEQSRADRKRALELFRTSNNSKTWIHTHQ